MSVRLQRRGEWIRVEPGPNSRLWKDNPPVGRLWSPSKSPLGGPAECGAQRHLLDKTKLGLFFSHPEELPESSSSWKRAEKANFILIHHHECVCVYND